MGVFRIKNLLQTDFEGEELARIYLGKIISCTEKNFPHDVYNAEKNLTLLYFREKISNSRGLDTHTQKSNGQPHKGWGRSLVPRPNFSSRPKRCGPRGPCKNVRAFPARWPRNETNLPRGTGKTQYRDQAKYMSSVKKMAGAHSLLWWFLRLKFCISQDTSGKRKFKRVLRFLFANKRELFAMKLSFEEFNLICFLHG